MFFLNLIQETKNNWDNMLSVAATSNTQRRYTVGDFPQQEIKMSNPMSEITTLSATKASQEPETDNTKTTQKKHLKKAKRKSEKYSRSTRTKNERDSADTSKTPITNNSPELVSEKQKASQTSLSSPESPKLTYNMIIIIIITSSLIWTPTAMTTTTYLKLKRPKMMFNSIQLTVDVFQFRSKLSHSPKKTLLSSSKDASTSSPDKKEVISAETKNNADHSHSKRYSTSFQELKSKETPLSSALPNPNTSLHSQPHLSIESQLQTLPQIISNDPFVNQQNSTTSHSTTTTTTEQKSTSSCKPSELENNITSNSNNNTQTQSNNNNRDNNNNNINQSVANKRRYKRLTAVPMSSDEHNYLLEETEEDRKTMLRLKSKRDIFIRKMSFHNVDIDPYVTGRLTYTHTHTHTHTIQLSTSYCIVDSFKQLS
jgi:hypothetical protein